VTLVEAAFAAGIIALALLALAIVLPGVVARARAERCKAQLLAACTGVRNYLNSFDEYFPPAWHVSGPALAIDLGNLAYHRFLIHLYTDGSPFRGFATEAECREAFRRDAEFWTDPERGATGDYFAPEIIFRLPEQQGKPFFGHAAVPAAPPVPPTVQPLFAEVNASVPHPEADGDAHGGETKTGIPGRFVSVFGLNVFIGVAESLRKRGEPSTTRFDFRHRGKANVAFLDHHLESVARHDNASLDRIYSRWDDQTAPWGPRKR